MRTGAFPCPGRTALDAPAGCVPHTEELDMPADPATPTPAPVPPPSKHQLALMIWLAVLPTLLVLGLVLDSLVDDSPTVVRTVVLATIAVPIVMYGLLPRLHRTPRPCAGAPARPVTSDRSPAWAPQRLTQGGGLRITTGITTRGDPPSPRRFLRFVRTDERGPPARPSPRRPKEP